MHQAAWQGLRQARFAPRRVERAPNHPARRRDALGGLTLVEMLVAMAVTLVMMAAVVNLFANLGGSVSNRRALIEVDGRLRQVRQMLAQDLAGATCPATTWHNPGANAGYIEILEGPYSDWNPIPTEFLDDDFDNGELDFAASPIPSSQMVASDSGLVTDGRALGDFDDVLALTVRNSDEPFVTRWQNDTLESPLAEVVWFARQEGDPDDVSTFGMRRVFRRVLLIAPWLDNLGNDYNDPPQSISARWNGSFWVGNTLGDLTRREYRFQHRYAVSQNPQQGVLVEGFPHPMMVGRLDANGDEAAWLMLSDALAFDVRVYDPGAPLFNVNGTALNPCDAGWDHSSLTGSFPAGYGAYVDLGWNRNGPQNMSPRRTWDSTPFEPATLFQQPHTVGSWPGAPFIGYPAVYDTWSWHYESDGVNQDAPPYHPNSAEWQRDTVDQGTNGLDDNYTYVENSNGVDDENERETAPPYDAPLRGVQIKLRVYERDARQVREVSVVHSFVD